MTRPVSPPPTPEETALKDVVTLESPGKRSKWLIHIMIFFVGFIDLPALTFDLVCTFFAMLFSIGFWDGLVPGCEIFGIFDFGRRFTGSPRPFEGEWGCSSRLKSVSVLDSGLGVTPLLGGGRRRSRPCP